MGWWEDLTGKTAASAANQAAQDTYAKQLAASQELKGFGDQYATKYDNLATAFQPYMQAGSGALTQLLNGLGINGTGGSQAFTNAYQSLPGYQAGLDTGAKAVGTVANAGNTLQSGSTLKALQRFGSDYEDQRSGDYLSRLMNMANLGRGATGDYTGTVGTGLQGQLGARTSAFGGDRDAAQTIGQGQIAAANAQQQGMQNLLGMGTFLGGTLLGGPVGGKLLGKLGF
jgi:hypothetical protein